MARGGLATDDLRNYLARIARGTAGVVIVGGSEVDESTWPTPGNLLLADPRTTSRLAPTYEAIHDASSLAINQLTHLGREGIPWVPGRALLGPGHEPSGFIGVAPSAMTRRDLVELLAAYQRAASNVMAAGADGVEVHAAHGYLVQQFLSPITNTRTDEYGGGVTGRRRLLLQILSELRERHPGRLVGVRLSAGEPQPGGLAWGDVLALAAALDHAKLVDYISLAVPSYSRDYVKDGQFPPGSLRPFSRELKLRVRVPVIVSQRINVPDVATSIVASRDADAVGLARALIADPEWGEKVAHGRTAEIRPCITCLQDCRRGSAYALSCAVHPALQAPRPRHVPSSGRYLVVGGGPAGCLAALTMRKSGAAVTLVERGERVGGQLRSAGSLEPRADWSRFADYLENALTLADVRVRLRTEVSFAGEMSCDGEVLTGYDGVVIAIGCTEPPPPDGLEVPVMTTAEYLASPGDSSHEAALVVDEEGTWRAASVVLRLLDAGAPLIYITPRERAFDRIPRESRSALIERLTKGGETFVSARLSWASGDLRVSAHGHDRGPVEARRVVWSAPPRAPRRALLDAVPTSTPLAMIGDALTPRGVSEACKEGWLIGELLARGRS